MKCAVIYFSLTGNTEKIAKAIQAGVKQAAGLCDIFPIKEANPRRLHEYDLIGLGCPVYGFVEPRNVKIFIEDMRFVGGKHVFSFATHGTTGDYFFPSIVPKLKRRGLIVVGMWDCYGASYMQGRSTKSPTDGHPDEIDLQEAEAFGKEMVERSRRISAGETNLIPSYPKHSKYNIRKYIRDRQKRHIELGMPANVTSRQHPRIKFNKEKCRYPKCRLCMENCPMDGVDLTVKPPVIARPCLGCGFCDLICPTGAIYLDFPRVWVAVPEEAERAIQEEFYLKPLAKAEAEGRFRRLVPEVGGRDSPRKEDKRPKWIIGKDPR